MSTLIMLCLMCALYIPKHSTHYAKLLYKEETSRFEDSSSEVNFAAFRNHLLPIVAEKKNMTIDQLLKRLAHFEEAAHPDLYSHLEVRQTTNNNHLHGMRCSTDSTFQCLL